MFVAQREVTRYSCNAITIIITSVVMMVITIFHDDNNAKIKNS